MPHKKAAAERLPVPVQMIERRIYLIRGSKVMLDFDLAELYRVPTKALNQAVRRNLQRFPEDFAFQLNKAELQNWRSQFVTSNPAAKMGLRRRPYAFTEYGALMLSSVLRSERAVQVNIAVVRTFVALRRNKRLAAIEKKLASHEKSLVVVFHALDKLKHPPRSNAIGFQPKRGK